MKKDIFLFFLFFFLIEGIGFCENFPKSTGKSFCKNLPDSIKNFHAVGKCEYTDINFTNQYVREAHREYESGNKKIILHIVEGPPALAQLNTFHNIVSIETADTIVKKIEFQGFQSLVHYNKIEKSGNVIIILNEQKPKVLLINYTNVPMEEIVDIIRSDISLDKFR